MNKVCRQEGCNSEVDRPRKRADCNECYNRIRREMYSEDSSYREEIKKRNVSRGRTVEGRASRMLSDAKTRARKKGLKFNLSVEDIVVPPCCPYLGIPLVTSNSSKGDDSPTLDRIVPELGYTKGNVEVISERANRIKNDGTPEELVKIAKRFSLITKEYYDTKF